MDRTDALATITLVDGLDHAETALDSARQAALALGRADLANLLAFLLGQLRDGTPRTIYADAGAARDALGGFADVLTGDDGLNLDDEPASRCAACGGPVVEFAGVMVCVGCPPAA